jgi:hypothetical protein
MNPRNIVHKAVRHPTVPLTLQQQGTLRTTRIMARLNALPHPFSPPLTLHSSPACWPSCATSAAAWPTCTAAASCTETSRRRTSCCAPAPRRMAPHPKRPAPSPPPPSASLAAEPPGGGAAAARWPAAAAPAPAPLRCPLLPIRLAQDRQTRHLPVPAPALTARRYTARLAELRVWRREVWTASATWRRYVTFWGYRCRWHLLLSCGESARPGTYGGRVQRR